MLPETCFITTAIEFDSGADRREEPVRRDLLQRRLGEAAVLAEVRERGGR
jgi:hypothetical protein